MKKILIATNVITVTLLLIAFTKPGQEANKKENFGIVSPTAVGVDAEVANDIVGNYKTDIWNGRKVNLKNYRDARSVWFSFAKIKTFIAEVESKVKNTGGVKGCDIDDFDLGVRIYFGNYPATPAKWDSPLYDNYFNDHKIPQSYVGLHTVMLVPTIFNAADSYYYDFDPRFRETGGANNCKFLGIDSVMKLLGTANSTFNPVTNTVNNQFYAIMPDNLDNKGLQNKEFTRSGTQKKDLPKLTSLSAPGNNVDFTNGGTLIPPPYPGENGTAPKKMIQPVSASATIGTPYNVPCSGASFMRWVDKVPQKCGDYVAPKVQSN